MRHFTNFGFFLLGIVIAFYACTAFAIEGPLTGTKTAGVSGNIFTTPPHPINTTYYEVDKAYVKTSDSKAVIVAREIPINIYDDIAKKEIRARVIEATKVSKPAMITAAKTILKRGARGPAGLVAPYMADWAIKQGWRWMNDMQQYVKSGGADDIKSGDFSRYDKYGYRVNCSQGAQFKTLSACLAATQSLHGRAKITIFQHTQPGQFPAQIEYLYNIDGASLYGGVMARIDLPSGSSPSNPPGSSEVPVQENDMTSSVESMDLSRAMEDILKSQQPVEYSRESLQFAETPTSEPVTKKETTKNPDGSTTSKETTIINNYKFEGDRITRNSNIKNTTTTTKPDGTTSTETSTTETQGEKPEPPPQWSDSEMPEVKELYKQKYPDGIKGIWLKKQGELSQTAFIRSLQTLAPSISGGTCPQFSIDTNNGWVSAGVLVFPVPCWIFDFLRAVTLLTAAFVARMIVFGG